MNEILALACPILRDQIDTDALIPVSENTRLSTSGFGEALFASWRYTNVEARIPDPKFPLNQPPFDRAQILIAGRNFGCGSSRESAVWALRDFGIQVVLAISFNETFQRNCIANRLWPLQLAANDAERLAQAVLAEPERLVRVTLSTYSVDAGGDRFPFLLDPYYCRLLSEGLTEEELLERFQSEIEIVSAQCAQMTVAIAAHE